MDGRRPGLQAGGAASVYGLTLALGSGVPTLTLAAGALGVQVGNGATLAVLAAVDADTPTLALDGMGDAVGARVHHH